jgi:hypothetical protein
VITGSLFQFTLGYRDLLAKDISMQGRKKTLQLLENAGGGLMEGFQTFLNLLAVQNSTLIVNGNIDAISNSIDFLLSTQIPAEDVWRLVLWHWPYSLMRPTPDAAIFLQVCLQKGLSPNLTTPEDRKPLLFRALAVMSLEKKWRAERKTMSNGDSGEYQGRQSIHANVSENEIPIIDGVNEGQLDYELTGIVELLIKAGADIYYQEQWCFDTAEPGNFSIWQPSDVAFRLGVLNEWHTALRNCGFDSDEIDYEGTRRDREAVRLRGVKRTGIDESVLSLPSYRGLRCRRCRRRFCSTHSPFHFCFN